MRFSPKTWLLAGTIAATIGTAGMSAAPAMATGCDSQGGFGSSYYSRVCAVNVTVSGYTVSATTAVGSYSANSNATQTSATIAWGDGTTDNLSLPSNDSGSIYKAHTYTDLASHTITIKRCGPSGRNSSGCVQDTATVTTRAPSSYDLDLDSYESDTTAASWQLPASGRLNAEQRTLAYCDSLGITGPAPSAGVCGNTVTSTYPMTNAARYTVAVSGTVSTWDWRTTACGTPVRLSNGYLTGIDAQYMFATSYGRHWCTTGKPLPQRGSAFQVSLDGGQTWIEPTATNVGTRPTASHTYSFSLTGKGSKPRFRFRDHWPQDNHGDFNITVTAN